MVYARKRSEIPISERMAQEKSHDRERHEKNGKTLSRSLPDSNGSVESGTDMDNREGPDSRD